MPGFAAVKALAIVALWSYFVLRNRTQFRSLAWFCSVGLQLAIWSGVALLHNVEPAQTAGQMSRMAFFFLVLGLGAYAAETLEISSERLDRLIVQIASFMALLKIGIIIGSLEGWFSLDTVQHLLGYEGVTEDIGFGIQRLQFPSDIVILFLLACYNGGRRRWVDLLLLLSITISAFLSFSRYLILAYVLAHLMRALRLRRVDFTARLTVIVVLIVGAIFSVAIVQRFVSQDTAASDTARTEQVRYIVQTIDQYPVFGKGLGSSVASFKRSETLPYSYEVEWYALTMQLGAIGLSWFVLNLTGVLFFHPRTLRQHFFFAVIVLTWVLSGFTNPYIVSLGSAFGLSILMVRTAEDSVAHSSAA